MKFQAAVIFQFKADSIADAAGKLDEVLKHAEQHHEMAPEHVELRTPPVDEVGPPTVILPQFGGARPGPGPQAAGHATVR